MKDTQIDIRRNAEGYVDTTACEAIKNVQRQQKGKRSKAVGEHFENMISRSCVYYNDISFAYIEKTPEPMKVLRTVPCQPGKFISCFLKAAQPDYKGTLKGGRAIVFEAKHTDKDKLERRRLTDKQMASLKKHYELGALAYVIVSFGLQKFYRIPWEIWRDMKKLYGRQYVTQEDICEYEIPACGGLIGLLNGVITL